MILELQMFKQSW